MNMDLLRDKSWRDVIEIWLAYHRTRDETLSAVIPFDQFNKLYNHSIKYPMVIIIVITRICNIIFINKFIYFFSLYCHSHATIVDMSLYLPSFSIIKSIQLLTAQYI